MTWSLHAWRHPLPVPQMLIKVGSTATRGASLPTRRILPRHSQACGCCTPNKGLCVRQLLCKHLRLPKSGDWLLGSAKGGVRISGSRGQSLEASLAFDALPLPWSSLSEPAGSHISPRLGKPALALGLLFTSEGEAKNSFVPLAQPVALWGRCPRAEAERTLPGCLGPVQAKRHQQQVLPVLARS